MAWGLQYQDNNNAPHFDHEVNYERACQQLDAVYVVEQHRRLKLQKTLLEEQNEELNAHLEEDDERIEELESFVEELQNDLEVALLDSEEANTDLRMRNREVETLKVKGTFSVSLCGLG